MEPQGVFQRTDDGISVRFDIVDLQENIPTGLRVDLDEPDVAFPVHGQIKGQLAKSAVFALELFHDIESQCFGIGFDVPDESIIAESLLQQAFHIDGCSATVEIARYTACSADPSSTTGRFPSSFTVFLDEHSKIMDSPVMERDVNPLLHQVNPPAGPGNRLVDHPPRAQDLFRYDSPLVVPTLDQVRFSAIHFAAGPASCSISCLSLCPAQFLDSQDAPASRTIDRFQKDDAMHGDELQ